MYKAILRKSAAAVYSGFLHTCQADSLDVLKDMILAEEKRNSNIRARMYEIYKGETLLGDFNHVYM